MGTVSNSVGPSRGEKKRNIVPAFLRKSPLDSVAKPGRDSSGTGTDSATGLGLTSGDGQTPVLTQKPDKLLATSEKRKSSTKKWSSKLGLRHFSSSGRREGKKDIASNTETRKLSSFIENKNWDGVREVLLCGDGVLEGSKEEPAGEEQDQQEELVKGKGRHHQQVVAALDRLVDYSGQNASTPHVPLSASS